MPSATPTTEATSTSIVIRTYDDLYEILRGIATASPEEARTRVDNLWRYLADAGRIPLILGEQIVFFYKGDADRVNWRGAFNGWSEPGLNGIRVGRRRPRSC